MAAKPQKKPAKKKPVKFIPEGFRTVTPHLIIKGGLKALAFYGKAFGAKERYHTLGPGGFLAHAELQIGDSLVTFSDEDTAMGARSPKTLGGTGSGLMIYSKDVDALFKKAVAAGAKVQMPLTDMFWGDRFCRLEDPSGHSWSLAKRIENVSPREMAKRLAAMGPPPKG